MLRAIRPSSFPLRRAFACPMKCLPFSCRAQGAEDDSGLLQVSPAFNSLNLVLRDPGVMRFIK